jgi:hypothetical protein
MDPMPVAAQDFPLDAAAVRRCRILSDSFARLLGRPLLSGLPMDDLALAQALYEAAPVIVSHGNEADPVFWFANRTAQRLWELGWERFTRMPSRQSVAPDEHEDREELLRRAREHGYIDDYRGVRISASGRRFRIEGVILWNLDDDQGRRVGQAAMFADWSFL